MCPLNHSQVSRMSAGPSTQSPSSSSSSSSPDVSSAQKSREGKSDRRKESHLRKRLATPVSSPHPIAMNWQHHLLSVSVTHRVSSMASAHVHTHITSGSVDTHCHVRVSGSLAVVAFELSSYVAKCSTFTGRFSCIGLRQLTDRLSADEGLLHS